MKSQSLGEVLQVERHAQKISREALAQATHIKLDFIKALESNDFAHLPPVPFVLGFIRSYARYLKLNPEPFCALLRRDYVATDDGKLLPREKMSQLSFRTPTITMAKASAMLVFGLFTAIFGYAIWRWYQFNQPPQLTIIEPQEDASVSGQVKVSGVTSLDAVVAVNADPVSLQPNGSFQTEISIPREGITTLTIQSTDPRGKTRTVQRTVWVRF